MKRRLAVLAAAAIVGTVLVGCQPTSAEKQTVESSGQAPAVADSDDSSDASSKDADSEDADSESDKTDDSSLAEIGQTSWYTYEDGLQVQVTSAKRYSIGQYAAGGQAGDAGVIITVTMKNGTGEAFDVDLSSVDLSAGPNGDTADSVFDSAKGISGGLEGSIAPGRSKTAKYAFAVAPKNLDELVVEVQPSWEHSSSFFEGSATT